MMRDPNLPPDIPGSPTDKFLPFRRVTFEPADLQKFGSRAGVPFELLNPITGMLTSYQQDFEHRFRNYMDSLETWSNLHRHDTVDGPAVAYGHTVTVKAEGVTSAGKVSWGSEVVRGEGFVTTSPDPLVKTAGYYDVHVEITSNDGPIRDLAVTATCGEEVAAPPSEFCTEWRGTFPKLIAAAGDPVELDLGWTGSADVDVTLSVGLVEPVVPSVSLPRAFATGASAGAYSTNLFDSSERVTFSKSGNLWGPHYNTDTDRWFVAIAADSTIAYIDGVPTATPTYKTVPGLPSSTSICQGINSSGQRVLAAYQGGLHYSADNGETWLEASLDPAISSGSMTRPVLHQGRWFSGLGNNSSFDPARLYVSDDSGETWSLTNTPELDSIYSGVWRVGAGDNALLALLGQNPTNLIRSTDGGDNWSYVRQFTGKPEGVVWQDGTWVLVEGYSVNFYGGFRVWTSSDDGDTWTNQFEDGATEDKDYYLEGLTVSGDLFIGIGYRVTASGDDDDILVTGKASGGWNLRTFDVPGGAVSPYRVAVT